MKKLTDRQQKVYAFVKKNFRKGQPLTYRRIGDALGFSHENTRTLVIQLRGLIQRKNGSIVGVK